MGPVTLHGIKKKLKSSNIVHNSSQTSSKNSHVDGELSDSRKRVDEKSRILSVVIPKAWMAKKALKNLTIIMEYEDPHKLNTCTNIHIRWLCNSSLHLHGESYTKG
jgi:hypothetical protein